MYLFIHQGWCWFLRKPASAQYTYTCILRSVHHCWPFVLPVLLTPGTLSHCFFFIKWFQLTHLIISSRLMINNFQIGNMSCCIYYYLANFWLFLEWFASVIRSQRVLAGMLNFYLPLPLAFPVWISPSQFSSSWITLILLFLHCPISALINIGCNMTFQVFAHMLQYRLYHVSVSGIYEVRIIDLRWMSASYWRQGSVGEISEMGRLFVLLESHRFRLTGAVIPVLIGLYDNAFPILWK